MSKKNTLANSAAPLAPIPAQAKVVQTVFAAFSKAALKDEAAQRAAGELLADGMLAWLATQPEERRAEIFVAVEAGLSQADCRKIAIHPLRPQIDPALIEVARDAIATAQANERAEKQRLVESAKRQREDAKRAKAEQKISDERAHYEALKAKFEVGAVSADGEGDEG